VAFIYEERCFAPNGLRRRKLSFRCTVVGRLVVYWLCRQEPVLVFGMVCLQVFRNFPDFSAPERVIGCFWPQRLE